MPSSLPEREPENPREEPGNGGSRRPANTLGLRVAVYFLAVFMGMSATSMGLYTLLEGPKAMERLAEADASDGTEVDPVLFLWLRVASVPVALAITLLVLRFSDGAASIASIGLRWPRSAGLQGLLALLFASLPLGLWLLLADPWVESTLVPFGSASVSSSMEAAGQEAAGPRELVPEAAPGAFGLASLAFAFLAVAFLEELIFRGYVYSAFRERFSWVNAAGWANLLFVALHAGHPEIGAAGLLNVFLVGLACGALREKTGSLWMPSLFSGFWNVLLGCALSLPISGTLFPRLFEHTLEGPETLTGGAFGPEGSWLLTAPLLVLVIGLGAWVDRGTDFEPDTPGEAEAGAEGDSGEDVGPRPA
ncbi:MAG: CPBP family intramembrane metalloprotease [Holophagales bacterium]|nr:CPBP family intramembrane metalloprotease [Holophagales bacterium]